MGYKVVLLGGPHVGKTSIIQQYVNHSFSTTDSRTQNADFLKKVCYVRKNPVELNIWDTAGQEIFNSLMPNYYRRASAILIVFDITERTSWDLAQGWVREVQEEQGVIALVGNKCDLADKKKMDEKEVSSVASSLGVLYFYTSAKSGSGLDDMFTSIAEKVLQRSSSPRDTVRSQSPKRVMLVDAQPHKKKGCC